MDNSELTPVSALGGYKGKFDDTSVSEANPLAIVSITAPRNGMDAMNNKLHELWQTHFPGAGECIRIDSARLAGDAFTLVLYGLQSDQCFLVAEHYSHPTQVIVDHIVDALANVAYLTDQSDSWAVLNIEGELTMPAMERICMLDLTTFQPSQVARTTMEHLSVIVEKQSSACVRLYSPRSTASGFLHAVTTSLQNVEQGSSVRS